MSEHIYSAFDEELAGLADRITRMGGLAEKQLTDAIQALTGDDGEIARRVITSDRDIDELEHEVEEQVVLMIVRRQPMAGDLREIMTAIKISSDLERIGDLAKNIAKRAIAIRGEAEGRRASRGINRMSGLALDQLHKVLDAYAQRDVDAALAVWHQDSELDALYSSIFRELLTYMMEDPRNISFATHLLFAAKNVERIGDHTTNISEMIYYLVEGETLSDERPKKDISSSTTVDFPEANA